MPDVTILTEADLRQLVPLDPEAVACIENAFRALATTAVVMPPILRLDMKEANGEVDVKTAYVPGIASFAIKISPGFFDNPALGLPSVNGLMVLLSARTGLLEASLFDNGYLTDVRTAAAGAVAAKHLAREDADTAAVLGAGVQAGLQLQALMLVRPIRSARLWARDMAKAERRAAELSAALSIPVTACPEPREAVRNADVVITTTPSDTPIFRADWLEPGQHITAMGSDAEHKNEIEPDVFALLTRYVPDRLSQTRILGELHHAIEAGQALADTDYVELGAIASGLASGRTDPDDITLADLTGTGVQDTAIATLAFQRAKQVQAGKIFST
ncbi:ectoine utilization protein EutC [Devosia rhodophyticola]|uniref:Ectoine utilization protein EutC n=1 Tax=Devosia rhodophyticola TaxID=3026423 RepID=A0ABY7Z1H4_9HYPH|nr:ectoine utilization protein EutC [Devosia rhodophyticola]WDR07488.1 ectoine utilization protein EutC [Devosia rhodophyticola]